ncbi:MAG: cyclic nucleotide-binding domain-containing protein [Candidatus Edwardsbacteria bacterium]
MVSVKRLKKFDMFKDLTESELEKVAPLGEERKYYKGEVIFEEGEKPEEIYLLEEGKVVSFVQLDIGPKSERINIIEEGDVFGLSALIGEAQKLTASAIAETNVKVITIKSKDLRRLFEREQKIGFIVMKNLNTIFWKRLKSARMHLISLISREEKFQQELF